MTHPSIAIIGSGPSGCYSAQFFRKQWPNAEIIVLEELPAPYGLLRYGVATDHQGTKSVAAQFDRLFERENIRFAGNVSVGQHLTAEEITSSFDLVIRATGLRADKKLSINTDPRCRVIGAGSFLRAINGYPQLDLPLDEDNRLQSVGARVGIIGMGNVSMDVIRILCKETEHFEGSDVDDGRLAELRGSGLQVVDVFGRSPIAEAKFDLSMLKELLALPNVRVNFTGVSEQEDCKALEALRAARLLKGATSGNQVEINFHFCATPQALVFADHSSCLQVERNSSILRSYFALDTIITAVGFTQETQTGQSEPEWDKPNVFKVGWLNREGKGTIAENRKDSKSVVLNAIAQIESGALPCKGLGYRAIEARISNRVVDFNGWRLIDEYERSAAPEGRCRRKLTDVEQMIFVARQQQSLAAAG